MLKNPIGDYVQDYVVYLNNYSKIGCAAAHTGGALAVSAARIVDVAVYVIGGVGEVLGSASFYIALLPINAIMLVFGGDDFENPLSFENGIHYFRAGLYHVYLIPKSFFINLWDPNLHARTIVQAAQIIPPKSANKPEKTYSNTAVEMNLQLELSELRRENQKIKKEKEHLEKLNHALSNGVKEKNAETAALQKRLERVEKEVKDSLEELANIEKLEKEQIHLKEDIKKKAQRIAEYEKHSVQAFGNPETNHSHLKNEIKKKAQRIAELEKQIEQALHNSKDLGDLKTENQILKGSLDKQIMEMNNIIAGNLGYKAACLSRIQELETDLQYITEEKAQLEKQLDGTLDLLAEQAETIAEQDQTLLQLDFFKGEIPRLQAKLDDYEKMIGLYKQLEKNAKDNEVLDGQVADLQKSFHEAFKTFDQLKHKQKESLPPPAPEFDQKKFKDVVKSLKNKPSTDSMHEDSLKPVSNAINSKKVKEIRTQALQLNEENPHALRKQEEFLDEKQDDIEAFVYQLNKLPGNSLTQSIITDAGKGNPMLNSTINRAVSEIPHLPAEKRHAHLETIMNDKMDQIEKLLDEIQAKKKALSGKRQSTQKQLRSVEKKFAKHENIGKKAKEESEKKLKEELLNFNKIEQDKFLKLWKQPLAIAKIRDGKGPKGLKVINNNQIVRMFPEVLITNGKPLLIFDEHKHTPVN